MASAKAVHALPASRETGQYGDRQAARRLICGGWRPATAIRAFRGATRRPVREISIRAKKHDTAPGLRVIRARV